MQQQDDASRKMVNILTLIFLKKLVEAMQIGVVKQALFPVWIRINRSADFRVVEAVASTRAAWTKNKIKFQSFLSLPRDVLYYFT